MDFREVQTVRKLYIDPHTACNFVLLSLDTLDRVLCPLTFPVTTELLGVPS